MRSQYLLTLSLLTLIGCSQSTPAAPTPSNPDNTAVNARDRNPGATTPLDQGENKTDIDITAQIRSDVVAAKLSIDAQNVKIITNGGKVTLRGPVQSSEEKKQIEQIALGIAGSDNVDNQLEISQRL